MMSATTRVRQNEGLSTDSAKMIGSMIKQRESPRNVKPLSLPYSSRLSAGRLEGKSMTPLSQRKQKYPKSISLEDDEDNLSNLSDFEDDESSTTFSYKTPAATAGVCSNCEWCDRMSTMAELTLVTQDRLCKTFCSEDCQEHFKEEILHRKVCEWCRRHFPNEPRLIVVEPSVESVPLQFCTQSCINKYKMELFCVEVKEQLRRIKEDNVQIANIASTKSGHHERKILITPELWSEGESALVFINDQRQHEPSGTVNNHNKSTEYESNERKRKGNSMENVINKLSKRHHRYSFPPPHTEDLSKHSHTPGNQTNAMNLTVHKAAGATNARGDKPNSSIPHNITSKMDRNNLPQNQDETPNKSNGSMVIPIPIFIPIPIPIPIPIATMSRALGRHDNATVQPKRESVTPTITQKHEETTPHLAVTTPRQRAPVASQEPVSQYVSVGTERRYILRRQLKSDEPE